jgi:hypothetical protein
LAAPELAGAADEFEWRFNQRDNPYLYRDYAAAPAELAEDGI